MKYENEETGKINEWSFQGHVLFVSLFTHDDYKFMF